MGRSTAGSGVARPTAWHVALPDLWERVAISIRALAPLAGAALVVASAVLGRLRRGGARAVRGLRRDAVLHHDRVAGAIAVGTASVLIGWLIARLP